MDRLSRETACPRVASFLPFKTSHVLLSVPAHRTSERLRRKCSQQKRTPSTAHLLSKCLSTSPFLSCPPGAAVSAPQHVLHSQHLTAGQPLISQSPQPCPHFSVPLHSETPQKLLITLISTFSSSILPSTNSSSRGPATPLHHPHQGHQPSCSPKQKQFGLPL